MHERDILLATLDLVQPEEREAFLAQVCGDDVELRSRVDALLRAAQVQDGFLESPAAETESLSRETDPLRQPCTAEAELSLDFLQPSDDPSALGRLGEYAITEVVGRGGMGVVLKARDTTLNRIVAIKVMAPELASNPTARKRFQREAHAAAAVVHQHIVTIHAVDEDRVPYLVMEYIDGQSLKEKIDREGNLKLIEILRIGQQVASGLAAAHAHGLMHRDVKPANILLENGIERVRITDFGLARAVDDVGMTRTGEVAGTPEYMSPEQAQGLPMDGRSDLFSFGCVLYAMCIGRPPFRAETAFATARRVCEDTPRPIREVNPEIPEWLVAIIDRLLAKQSGGRFQTAAEVAGLLGQRLAELQHPSLVHSAETSLPQSQIPNPKSQIGLRRWPLAAIAAAIVLLLAVTLTEATGVTHFAPTLIRIATGEGTLLVVVNDPDVKVTVEGDGGLVITGAGIPEFRLPPGSYRVRAEKDGKLLPLNKEVVTISRGGREVVKVRFEGQGVVAQAQAPSPEKQAFVILGAGGDEVGKFDTLAEAVQSASDGDTIEIRGNGPFVTEPITLRSALTIRAGEGFQPTLQLDPRRGGPLLTTEAPLVLEGIEFLHQPGNDVPVKTWSPTLKAGGAVLQVANCRFIRTVNFVAPCVYCSSATRAEFRNSHFTQLGATGSGISYGCPPMGTLVVRNCAHSATFALTLNVDATKAQHVTIRLRNNTWAARNGIQLILSGIPEPIPESDPADAPLVTMDSAQNVFDFRHLFMQVNDTENTRAPPPKETLADACRRFIAWRDEGSLYPTQILLGVEATQGNHIVVDGQAEWDRFWNLPPTAARSGTPKFQGGNALSQSGAQALGPEAFRLLPDSPGYRAGKDGKDLGADVDLVGPGAAYERWKKTPAYQQWLKESGQEK